MDRSDAGRRDAGEAVLSLSALTETSHDNLVEFSNDLKALNTVPDFWSGATPVWIGALRAQDMQSHWPVLVRKHQTCTLRGFGRDVSYIVREADLIDRILLSATQPLSAAELRLSIDLAQGLTLTESAHLTGVSPATRRKQAQNVFRKLNICSQTELILFITDAVNQFVIDLAADAPGSKVLLHNQKFNLLKIPKTLTQRRAMGCLGLP